MEAFWKAVSIVLIAVILGLSIEKKDFSVLLTLAVCCIVTTIAVSYLKPVVNLLWKLNQLGQFQDGILSLLLKAVGIALVSEWAALICADAGNHSMSKLLQLFGCIAIASLSVPIFESTLTLIQDILFTV